MKLVNGHLSLPDNIISEIRLLSGIAKANGSFISLKDVVTLTDISLSEESLEAAWPEIPDLASLYELKNGLLIEREHGDPQSHSMAVEREIGNRVRAWKYVDYARKFVSLCISKKTSLIAISGSTSYRTVSETDDLDLFCMTKPDYLWIFLTKSLLLSRFFHLSQRSAPRPCFSYAVDQSFAEREFTMPNDALFARDALSAIVIAGTESYKRLLKRSSWMSNYFPKLYRQRTGTPEDLFGDHSVSPPLQKFLNLLLRVLVGNYIAVKSAMLNQKLRKQDRSSSIFTLKLGSDHCIFESARYAHLRHMYRQFSDKTRQSRQSPGLPR